MKIMSVFCSSQSFLMMLKIVTTNLRTKTLSYQCILLVILGKHLVNYDACPFHVLDYLYMTMKRQRHVRVQNCEGQR